MNRPYLLFLLIISSLISGCIRPKESYTSLAPGIWRGALKLSSIPTLSLKDEIERYEKEGTKPVYDPEDELPFLFEVFYRPEDQKPYIEIINGTERIRIDEVYTGRNKNTAEDTVWIEFVAFDSHIRGIMKEGIIQGEWVARNRVNYTIPFVAHFGKKDRFLVVPSAPVTDLTGTWDCLFDLNLEKTEKAIGEFKQIGASLTGTFRTESGDHRYLEGTVTGNKFFLSAFDGSHAYLFFGKITGDSLLGTFKSGNHFLSVWTAVRNAEATLSSATQRNKETGRPVQFNFLNPEGEIRSLKDYDQEIKILQIMGTWCPNCYDETRFLMEYLNKNQGLDIAVIGLACERHRDTVKAMNAIRNYRKKLDVPYEILLAATTTSKPVVSKQLPFLDTILAFPTLVILDKNNKIHSIHTGFDGPATSKYPDFVKEFGETIQTIKEKIQ